MAHSSLIVRSVRAPPSLRRGRSRVPHRSPNCGQPPTMRAIIAVVSQPVARSSQAVGTYVPQLRDVTVGAMNREQINELRNDGGARRLVTQLRERALLDDDAARATRLLVEFEQQAAQIENDRARSAA